MVLCKYFMQGNCSYGDRCWNEHPSGGNKGFSVSAQRQLFGGGNKGGVTFGNSNPNPYKWTAQGAQQQQQQQNKGPVSVQQMSAADIVKGLANEIVMNWDNGKMWPFSCFGYEKDAPSLPGFSDICPEELRLEAYEALKQGSIQPYVQKVESLYNGVQSQWQELKNPNMNLRQKLISFIEDNRRKDSSSGGQVSLFSDSSPFGSSTTPSTGLFGQGNQSSAGTFGQSAPQSTFGQTGSQQPLFGQSTQNQSSFGFGMSAQSTSQGQSQTGPPSGFFSQTSSPQTSAAAPSFGSAGGTGFGTGSFGAQSSSATSGQTPFGTPAPQASAPAANLFGKPAPTANLFGKPAPAGSNFGAVSAPSQATGSTGSEASSVYTPIDKLTPQEVEQFQAATFSLGKIPTKPPPRELCM